MTKVKTIFIFLMALVSVITKAQTYEIKSFDNKTAKIEVKELARTLTITYLKDKIVFTEYEGIKNISVLNNKFLLVTYSTRGGTGLDTKNTCIILANDNKLQVAAIFNSYAKLVSPDKQGLFTSNFSMEDDHLSKYRLVIQLRDQQTSKINPKTNYNQKKKIVLTFNPIRKVFYGENKSINESFLVSDVKTSYPKSIKINEIVPFISLAKYNYYYTKDGWYKSGYGNSLFKEYYK